jgi:hypothetical protein
MLFPVTYGFTTRAPALLSGKDIPWACCGETPLPVYPYTDQAPSKKLAPERKQPLRVRNLRASRSALSEQAAQLYS